MRLYTPRRPRWSGVSGIGEHESSGTQPQPQTTAANPQARIAAAGPVASVYSACRREEWKRGPMIRGERVSASGQHQAKSSMSAARPIGPAATIPSNRILLVQSTGSQGVISCRDNATDNASSCALSSGVKCPSLNASSILASLAFTLRYSSLDMGRPSDGPPQDYGRRRRHCKRRRLQWP